MSWWKRKPRSWFIGVFVRDVNGRPVPNASVMMRGQQASTGANGWCQLPAVTSQQNTLDITAERYAPYHAAFFGDTELSGSPQNIPVAASGSELDTSLPVLVPVSPAPPR